MTKHLAKMAKESVQKQTKCTASTNADEAAFWQAFAAEPTPELEALLNEALSHSGKRIPLEELLEARS